jgi:hypothetical protein
MSKRQNKLQNGGLCREEIDRDDGKQADIDDFVQELAGGNYK